MYVCAGHNEEDAKWLEEEKVRMQARCQEAWNKTVVENKYVLPELGDKFGWSSYLPGGDGSSPVKLYTCQSTKLESIPEHVRTDLRRFLLLAAALMVSHRLPQKSITCLLTICSSTGIMKPEYAEYIPKDASSMLSLLEALGTDFIVLYRYDVCPTCAFLYRWKGKDCQYCPHCKCARYRTDKKSNKVPLKSFLCASLANIVQLMYSNKNVALQMRHHEKYETDVRIAATSVHVGVPRNLASGTTSHDCAVMTKEGSPLIERLGTSPHHVGSARSALGHIPAATISAGLGTSLGGGVHSSSGVGPSIGARAGGGVHVGGHLLGTSVGGHASTGPSAGVGAGVGPAGVGVVGVPHPPVHLGDVYLGSRWLAGYRGDPILCNDPRNIGLVLGSDGVLPFKEDKGHKRKNPYGFDVLLGIFLNLPPWLRTKPGALALFGLATGPRVAHLQSYFLLIMHQILHAYLEGIEVADAAWQPGDRSCHGHPLLYKFLCHIGLLSALGDAPAFAHMLCNGIHGAIEHACAFCR
jgi:hypothetical protein